MISRKNLRATMFLAASAAALGAPGVASGQEVAVERDKVERDARERAHTSDIVVTGRSLMTEETALPVQLLAGGELAHRRQGGLGETLAGLPGVHLDNFGGGASRPVIRGQTMPRIEILSDGANLFDVSSVSPDHAITTDPLLLDAIEIQRGPAAVRYGGNAVNGAINLIDSKVPKAMPVGGLTGATEVRFGTGDQEKTVVGRITAGVGQFAIHAEAARRAAEDYDVPNSYGTDKLRDSFAENTTYAVGASWITSKGYIGAAYTRTESEYGLPGHSHLNGVCHTHGLDLHCTAHGEYEDPFGSSDDHTAYIRLRSERAEVRADYDDLLPGLAHVRLRGSYTDYVHDEIDGPSLFSRYSNEVWDGRVELTHKPLLGFTGTLGGQYTRGTFAGLDVNDAHVPTDPSFVFGYEGNMDVRYVTDHYAVFLSERRSFGAIDIDIAARKEWRYILAPLGDWVDPTDPELLDVLNGPSGSGGGTLRDFFLTYSAEQHLISHPKASHDPFQVSVGAIWNMANGYSASLSLARTERAPSVRELYALGNNLATNSYEVGLLTARRASSQFPVYSSDLMETAKTANLTLRKAGGSLEFEIGVFYQDIDNYIFGRLIETDQETGVLHTYLAYTAADARFAGIDGQVSYQFTPKLRLTVFGDYVDTKLKNQNDNLPRISPGRLGARYEHTAGLLSADVEYYHTFEQDKVASYETRTPGYNMLNATLSYRFDLGQTKEVELYVRGSNLLNELAFVHTSFVKNQSPLRGRNFVIGMRHAF